VLSYIEVHAFAAVEYNFECGRTFRLFELISYTVISNVLRAPFSGNLQKSLNLINYDEEYKNNELFCGQMATLHGLPVPRFLQDFMKPFTKYPVETLADFSSRLPASYPSNATAEGRHIRCFEKVLT
jgi:hypothetical protein